MVKRYEAGTEARAHVWLQQLQWSGNIGPTVNGNLAGGGARGGGSTLVPGICTLFFCHYLEQGEQGKQGYNEIYT